MFPSVSQNEHAQIDLAGSEGLAGTALYQFFYPTLHLRLLQHLDDPLGERSIVHECLLLFDSQHHL